MQAAYYEHVKMRKKGDMPDIVAEFLKSATNAFIDDCSVCMRTAIAPLRIASNEVQAVLIHSEATSKMKLEKSLNEIEIYDKFLRYKRHYSTSPDRDGKYVYHFLCSIEDLSSPENRHQMRRVAAFIDAEPDLARIQIGKAMAQIAQNGMQGLGAASNLALPGIDSKQPGI